MSIRTLALAVTLIALVAAPAGAEQGADYARSGAYVGGGLAVAIADIDNRAFTSDFDTGIGFDAYAGYRISPHFATELEIEYVDRVNISGGTIGPKGNLMAFTGNVKGYILTGRFQPFALAGLGLNWAGGGLNQSKIHKDQSGLGFRFGAGFDYYLDENWSLGSTASYVLGTGNVKNMDWWSVVMGAQYRF